MPKAKAYRDHLLRESKETVISMYRNCERARNWYERLEVLRERGVRPCVRIALDLGETDPAESKTSVSAEVFAPNAADGGVIRVVWFYEGKFTAVNVQGYEDWIRENVRNMHAALGVRVLAERLTVAIDRIRRPAMAEVA